MTRSHRFKKQSSSRFSQLVSTALFLLVIYVFARKVWAVAQDLQIMLYPAPVATHKSIK